MLAPVVTIDDHNRRSEPSDDTGAETGRPQACLHPKGGLHRSSPHLEPLAFQDCFLTQE